MTDETANAKRQLESDRQQFYKRRKLFEDLLQNPAWKELEGILLAQHAMQLAELLAPPRIAVGETPIDGLAQTLVGEYRKGVVFGIQLTLKTPHATIETAKEILAEFNRQHEGQKSDASRTDNDGHDLPDGAIVTDLSGAE